MIQYTVTFKVENGEWNDGGSDDKTVTLSRKENEDLLNKVNAALEELIADGTVQTIVDKYINAD